MPDEDDDALEEVWAIFVIVDADLTLTDMISDLKPRSGSRLAKSLMRRHSSWE